MKSTTNRYRPAKVRYELADWTKKNAQVSQFKDAGTIFKKKDHGKSKKG
jgi:hypothetical protein